MRNSIVKSVTKELNGREELGKVQMLWLIDTPLINAPHSHSNLVTLHANNDDDKLKALF